MRTDRFGALRGLYPPFQGKLPPQVHRNLQVALNARAYVSARPEQVSSEFASHSGSPV